MMIFTGIICREAAEQLAEITSDLSVERLGSNCKSDVISGHLGMGWSLLR